MVAAHLLMIAVGLSEVRCRRESRPVAGREDTQPTSRPPNSVRTVSPIQYANHVGPGETLAANEDDEHKQRPSDANPKTLTLNGLFGTSESRLTFEGTCTIDSSKYHSGGINRGAIANRNLMDLRLATDTGKLLHHDWQGAIPR